MGYIYLASPYTGTKVEMAQRHFLVQKCTAHFFSLGIPIFSPIVHCHTLACEFDIPKGIEFWKNYDILMLTPAMKLWVLCLDGWELSKGVKFEIEHAKNLNKTIEYVDSVLYTVTNRIY